MKTWSNKLRWGLGISLGIGIGTLISSLSGSSQELSRTTALPLVLERVRAIGDLHTVQHAYSQVFEFETARRPTDWAAKIPGVEGVVLAATRNRGLVSVAGTVEAGVDFTKARYERLGNRVDLVLPKPKIYPAYVEAKVNHQADGWFWRDQNFGLKALDSARARFQQNSRERGILTEAEAEARTRVLAMLRPVASNVAVRFE
ncbi:MAG: hypothetical protein HONBIEJF_01609 [Fimbriimonadaceae bacterium]|nr:hypothetical protein [Fimbriimonadaceae bacterium]